MAVNWSAFEDPAVILRLILQVLLFAASALFSMSETALFSLRETDIQRIEHKNPGQANAIRDLLSEPRRLIISILCGNELVNIAATVNLTGILLILLGTPQAAAIANAFVMIVLLLLLCEITPKTVAVTAPVAASTRLIEPCLTPWVRIVAPLRALIRLASDRATALVIGREERRENILSADDFAFYLRDVEREGIVSRGERRLILNLIEASSTPVSTIMVPRPQVHFIDADLPVDAILEQFRTLRHRRVPLYRQQRDNVIGVLREERVLAAVLRRQRGEGEIALEDLVSPAMIVPSTQTVSELAELFKDGDHHAALVMNEFGGIEGLASADDVFGYLTRGQRIFLDAHDRVEALEDGSVRCAGLTPLRSLQQATGLAPAREGDIMTVGGLIMALLGRLPRPGDQVEEAGTVLRVLAMEGLLVGAV
ncbi:MAG: hemolysin family protein, partial [Pseudomonadota bacterium]